MAEWYDSYLSRFISADSIIPNPGNVLDWDRFAAMRNNPLRYIDPTGHRTCTEKQAATGDETCDQNRTTTELVELISYLYGWEILGDWNKNELLIILDAGKAISNFVNRMTQSSIGNAWIREYTGNTVFRRDLLSGIFFGLKLADGVMMFRNVIRLPAGFNLETALHEIAHVFDNNFRGGILPATYAGGGPTDAFIRAMGGDPSGCIPRWYCPKTHYGNAGIDRWRKEDFVANHSAADDFAKTFAVTIINPGIVSQARRIWMESFIFLSARNLR